MAAKYVEPRMTPLVHQRNHIRADFAFTQKHFQYYVPKNFLQHAGINGRGNGKHTVFMETSVGNENMQVRIKAQKITEALNGNYSAGDSLLPLDSLFVIKL